MFGPPMTYWTGRFESKHQTAKATATAAKNVKNITKTLSERQQMRAASVYYHGMFDMSQYTLPEAVMSKTDLVDDTPFNCKLKEFMCDDDLICSSIFVNSQMYKNDDLVVLEVIDNDNICVGIIQTILLRRQKIYFVVQKHKAERNILRVFDVKQINDPVNIFVSVDKLADFKPVVKRGTSKRFMFVLHHHVSYQYS